MKVVFLDRDTLSAGTRLRTLAFEHDLVCHGRTSAEQVAERVADADIVLVNKVRIDARTLAAARRQRCIAVAATGSDAIDLAACRERGIVVSNIRNYAVHSVPEHTFSLIFALRRSLCAYRDAVRAGRWQASGQFCFFDHPIRDLVGSTLGMIGDSVLGLAVAAIEPPATDHPFMKLLDRPDFILTPHVAWASDEANQSMADSLVDNVEAFARGVPRHVVGL